MPQPIDYSSAIRGPDLGQKLLSGLQLGQGIRSIFDRRDAAEQARVAKEQYSTDLTAAMENPTAQAFASLTLKYPQQSKAFKQSWDVLSQDQKDSEFSSGVQAYSAIRSGKPEVAMDLLDKRIEAMKNNNQDTRKIESMRASLERDPQGTAAHIGLTLSSVDPDRWGKIAKQMGEAGADGPKSPVQSSTILEDGTVQFIRKDGTIEIVAPDAAGAELIKQAKITGAKLQGLRAGEREDAKASSKLAVESFKGLSKVRKNMTNFSRAIKLIDEGAGTGRIEKIFPSFKAASVKLDQVRGELGLDVIGMTTFGALSESELEFALATALPTGLNESELRTWLTDKQAAQAKVAANLEEAAIYLGTPGNGGIAGFLELKKGEKEQAAPQGEPAAAVPAGWTVKVK